MRPLDLIAHAASLLAESDPQAKCEGVAACAATVAADAFLLRESAPVPGVDTPGRPGRPLLVNPLAVPRRRLGTAQGRAALLHAIAHIEFNAINLALDAVCRFRGLPREYYRDWFSVAVDEARHFRLLTTRLGTLGHAYGDFAAHNGLWELAQETAHSCLLRMALVPRVLEARGLDVTPGMIARLRAIQDAESAEILELILAEEVRHVALGTHWFRFECLRAGLDPATAFADLLKTHYRGVVRGPFNREARARAGFSADEMAQLEEAQ